MIEILETKQIALSDLTDNKGQIDGIPKNPRFIKDYRYERLVKSIKDNPEFLGARELIVHKHNGKYVVLCGNMRYRAAKELGFDSIPCKVIPEYFSIEQIKAIIIKDNISFGDDDFDALANEWDATELEDWGLEFPINDKIDKIEDGETLEFEQSVQLEPPKEYILIMAEPNSVEWEELKEILKLKMVRRGGYKKGSAFDSIGLERVLWWDDFKNRINVNSSTK